MKFGEIEQPNFKISKFIDLLHSIVVRFEEIS